MTWLLPSALVIGGLAALVAGALHLIARSEPRPEPFPTARFVPDRPLRARSRTIAPSDLALLVLRLAALVAIAAAVAAPRYLAARSRVLRVIALDRSRYAATVAELADSARALARVGDLMLGFDTTATVISTPRAVDSLALSRAPGSLSVALAAAIGLAARVADRADSIELVVVSPFSAAESDAATLRIRRTWPGPIRLVRIAAAQKPELDGKVESSSATTDDPLVAVLALAGARGATGSIRLARDEPSSADSAWAHEKGHLLVHWPAAGATSWRRRAREDTVGGVTAGDAVVVARFPRPWIVEGRAIARWVDGEAAAVEQSMGQGCLRDVAIPLDPASDVTLRPAFRRFLGPLLAPCDGVRDTAGATATVLALLAGEGAGGPVSTSSLSASRRDSPWTLWLLLLGAALLIAELGARRARSVVP